MLFVLYIVTQLRVKILNIFKPKTCRKILGKFVPLSLIIQILFSNIAPVFAATFTPGMAKRHAPGPFDAGVIVQGDTNPGKGDVLFGPADKGGLVGGEFYQHLDLNQGSLVFWITPEWNGNDGKYHAILEPNINNLRLAKDADDNLSFFLGTSGASHSVDISSWTAGTTYQVVARWDTKNTLNGSAFSISINDSHSYGGSVGSGVTMDLVQGLQIGSYPSTVVNRASAIIEGLTIYRRPLFDGTHGVDVGNGDEIAKIYDSDQNNGNGITSQDPTLVTGSWDVVFALPTNSSTGALTTGTGNAWSHPHLSNLLYTSTTNTGGFMLNGTPATDSWSAFVPEIASNTGFESDLSGWNTNWWELPGETVVAAYQPKGAVDLSGSYTNLANPGTYTAAPGVAPTFNTTTGWTFNASSTYLTTGIVPTSHNWTYLVRYSNGTSGSRYVFGSFNTSAAMVGIIPYNSGAQYLFNGAQANFRFLTGGSTSGVLGIAGYLVFRDGSHVGTITSSAYSAFNPLYIGQLNGGGASNFWGGNLQAFVVYSTPLDATQAATITNRMNALGTTTRDTDTKYSGNGSAKVIASDNYNLTQTINVGNTGTYNLEAYAYTDGNEVTSSDIELYYNGSAISTTFTDVGNNWYQLSGSVTGANENRDYGVQVKSGKTVYVDEFSVKSDSPTISALATNEKIFTGGYKYTSSGANQGISSSFTATNGGDYVLRALGHSDGSCSPQVKITRADGTTEISHLNGTTGSTRADPDAYIFTWESPAAEQNQVQLINTASSGTCYWHQVEVLPNLISNPSMELGGGNPWIPTGWTNVDIGSGETAVTSSPVHSGSRSMQWDSTNRYIYASPSVPNSRFAAFGLWSYGDGTAGFELGGRYCGGIYFFLQHTASSECISTSHDEEFKHSAGVFRKISDVHFALAADSGSTGSRFVDDVYGVLLSDVSLTITPASQANSTENTDEIRVDGQDTYVATAGEAISVGANTGFVSFNYRPRHSAADAVKFAETPNSDAYLLTLYGDGDDYVNLYWDSANTLRLSYSAGGETGTGTWDATGEIAANTEYLVSLAYTGDGNMVVEVGGTDRITLSSIPSAFGTAPNTLYFGSDSGGANQGDATFSNIVFDSNAPSISLNVFTPDPTLDNTPLITGTATESIGTISSVEFQMDGTGGAWASCSATDLAFNEASEEFTCTTSTLSDGSHTIYIRSTDSNGNTTTGGSESTDTFTIDSTSPTVPGTPSTTSPTADITPTWTWTASTDATSGLADPAYTIQWSTFSDFSSGINSATVNTNSFTHSTPLTDDTWYFRTKATDNAGNESNYSSTGEVEINTGAPEGSISINSAATYTNSRNVTLAVSASSGFFLSTDDIEMKVSNLADLSDATFEDFSASKTWTLTQGDGTKTVYVQFKDTTNNTSGAYTDTIVLDTNPPSELKLKKPASKAYTSEEREDFSWYAATDSTSGISEYKLTLDNSESDIKLTEIPREESSAYETSKYIAKYRNFEDDGSDNDYLSIHTKSSITWGLNQNNGKLREGKRTWEVTAYDAADNQVTSSRTLFVDRTGPKIKIEKINDTQYTAEYFSTNDATPTLKGLITDTLEGDSHATKVASGPKSVDIKIEKKSSAYGAYDPHTQANIELDETYWENTKKQITDNTQNTSNKYSKFEFTPKNTLTMGDYKVTVQSTDNVGNVGDVITFNLRVDSQAIKLQEVTKTPTLTKEDDTSKADTNNQGADNDADTQHITQEPYTNVDEATKPNLLQKASTAISNVFKDFYEGGTIAVAGIIKATGNGVQAVISGSANAVSSVAQNMASLVGYTFEKTGNFVAVMYKIAGNGLAFVGNKYMHAAQKMPSIGKQVLSSIGNSVNSTGDFLIKTGVGVEKNASDSSKIVKSTTMQVNQSLQIQAKATSNTIGLAVVNFGYKFVNEPTRIYNIKVVTLSPNSAKITWQTNHPANSEVDYGLDETYANQIQSQDMVTEHVVILTNLQAATEYHFEVMSHGKTYVYNANRRFTTPKAD